MTTTLSTTALIGAAPLQLQLHFSLTLLSKFAEWELSKNRGGGVGVAEGEKGAKYGEGYRSYSVLFWLLF